MKNIESVLQIRNATAVIEAEDLALLLGRKHLSVLRAIDAMPAEYLTDDSFFMVNNEVYLTKSGVLMLDMSRRHLNMRRKIMMALSIFDTDYREARRAEFVAAMPFGPIIRLLAWLDNVGLKRLALLLFKLICLLKNYDPTKTVNIHKKTAV